MSTREERLELRLQGEAAYSPKPGYYRERKTSQPVASRKASEKLLSPRLSNSNHTLSPGSSWRSSRQGSITFGSKRDANGGGGSGARLLSEGRHAPLQRQNTEELIRLQERRERAREQERLERQREQERLERDDQDNLIPDSKKAPQVLAAISVSTGCISYGICMAYTSSAVPSMLAPNSSLIINMTTQETTWMSSLLALGALFGSLAAVYLMDAVGRKASLLAFSVMTLFIGWTLLMAASQVWQLYAGRFFLGFGAGLEITISPVYIHEICRPVLRDVCGSFPQVFIAIGVLLCYLMGRDLEWNWLALVSCMFLFPFTFGLYFIPESPPWLVYNDEEDLAFKSMVLIRGEEYDATVEIRRIKNNLTRHRNDLHALLHESELTELRSEEELPSKFKSKDLLQKSVLQPFMVILVLMFLLQFCGQGAITFYTELIFEEAECLMEPKNSAVIIGLSYLLSSIVGLFLKKHMGRRFLLLASEFGMAVAQLAMGTYFYFLKRPDNPLSSGSSDRMIQVFGMEIELMKQLQWLPIPILVLFTVAFNIGMGSLTWVVATEILPVRSKRWTHTIANVTSNFWWFVVTKTFTDISNELGPSVPFFIYGGVCTFGFVFIFVFLPETHGKTAEETARAFNLEKDTTTRPVAYCGLCCLCQRCWPLKKLVVSAQDDGGQNTIEMQ